jgi:hypothetical protein
MKSYSSIINTSFLAWFCLQMLPDIDRPPILIIQLSDGCIKAEPGILESQAAESGKQHSFVRASLKQQLMAVAHKVAKLLYTQTSIVAPSTAKCSRARFEAASCVLP